MQLYTKEDGWIETSTPDLDDRECIDCDQPATRTTSAGRNPKGQRIYWAQCEYCAFESVASGYEASRNG